MPDGTLTILVMLVLAILVAIVLPLSQKAATPTVDPFLDSGELPPRVRDMVNQRTEELVIPGQRRYNKLSDTHDITKPNFMRTGDSESELTAGDNEIISAMRSVLMVPDVDAPTGQGADTDSPDVKLPPGSGVLENTRKCEAIKGRAGCDVLGKPGYENCGICIKGGTSYTDPDNEGKHIGGMLVFPEDKEEAEQRTGGSIDYYPSIGSCPPGYFFVNKDACKKGVNRENCKEIGETGGFNGGRTIEGKTINEVSCAAVPASGDSTYVYDTKNRKFRMNLRIQAPVGTGITRVRILDQATGVQKALGSGVGELVLLVSEVKEGDKLSVEVLEEVPYRPTGRAEVFQYRVNMDAKGDAGYTYDQSAAKQNCERIGAQLATKDQLSAALTAGAQVCSTAWAQDFIGWPMQARYNDGNPDHNGWCGGPGKLNNWAPKNAAGEQVGHSWCYGVKPPNSTNLSFFNKVVNFFESLGANAEPSQASLPNIWSQFGDYQAPSYRAFVAQWESTDGRRKLAFERTLNGVNGSLKDSENNIRGLKKFGTFNASSVILNPRPATKPNFLTNLNWIWGADPLAQKASFEVVVPGTFLSPVYTEDTLVAPAGPLVTLKDSLNFLQASPCDRSDQKPGNYSESCLRSIFVSAGGDPYYGTLAKDGLSKLNRLGDGTKDTITAYLVGLYTTATKGKTKSGMRATMTEINDAAMKMFGFEIVSPCEDIQEDSDGNIQLIAKTGAVDADCLDYLWKNTGNDRDRGREDRSRRTMIKNTYTSISDRYSGLRSSEGSKKARDAAPFTTCKSSGSMAPINEVGKINMAAVNAANAKGSIPAIQDFYDTIHKAANYKGGSQLTESDDDPASGKIGHTTAIDYCYGIKKAPVAKTSCGVKARYIRILPTGIYAASDVNNLIIQVSQVQVFDEDGKEVARGKLTRAGSTFDQWRGPEKAVDGYARARTFMEGIYHSAVGAPPDKQYWMVDLGKEVDVSKVVFYPRSDCCQERQIAAPVQLVNGAGAIVAEKWLGQQTLDKGTFGKDPEVLTFSTKDTRPSVSAADMKPNVRVSLFTATSFDRVARHAGFAFYVSGPMRGGAYDTLTRQDGTLVVRPANNGMNGYISFESVNFPNYFMRHAGFRLYLHEKDGSRVFNEDSSFKIVPALNGDQTMLSFQSANFPDHYISVHREAPTQMWITPIDLSNPWDLQRASWSTRNGLALL